MTYTYKTKGTCSTNIELEVEDGIVRNIARFWKVRPMPSCEISCVGVLVIDLPSNWMSPAW